MPWIQLSVMLILWPLFLFLCTSRYVIAHPFTQNNTSEALSFTCVLKIYYLIVCSFPISCTLSVRPISCTTSNSLTAAPTAVTSSIQAYIILLHNSIMNCVSSFLASNFSDATDTPVGLTTVWLRRAGKLKPNEAILDQLGLEFMNKVSPFFLGQVVWDVVHNKWV